MSNVILKCLRTLNMGGLNDILTKLEVSNKQLKMEIGDLKEIKKTLLLDIEEKNELEKEYINLIKQNQSKIESLKTDLRKISIERDVMVGKVEWFNKKLESEVGQYVKKKLEILLDELDSKNIERLYNIAVNIDVGNNVEYKIVERYIPDEISGIVSKRYRVCIDDIPNANKIQFKELFKFGDIYNLTINTDLEIEEHENLRYDFEYQKFKRNVKSSLILYMSSKEPLEFLKFLEEIEFSKTPVKVKIG